jgi:hypothetical protein
MCEVGQTVNSFIKSTWGDILAVPYLIVGLLRIVGGMNCKAFLFAQRMACTYRL